MASIMDQFEQDTSMGYNPFGRLTIETDQMAGSGVLLDSSGQLDTDVPIFKKQRIKFKPPSAISHFAVCNNFLVLAMDTNVLLRIDMELPDQIDEVEITRSREEAVHRLFQDPTGRHVIISLTTGENLYLSRNSKRPKPINKLRGHLITSIGWNWQNSNDSGTATILIGTSKGCLFETEINCIEDSRIFQGSLEQYVKLLFTVSKDKETDQDCPITGITFDRLTQTSMSEYRYYIMATIPVRLYHFVGSVSTSSPPPMFAPMFQEIDPAKAPYKEIPSTCAYSELQMFCPKFREPAKGFAWLTGPGVYYGDIDIKAQNDAFMANVKLLYHSDENSAVSDRPAMPVSLCLTEFHVLVLFPDRLRAYCTLNPETVVYETTFRPGNMLGLYKDPIRGFIFAYSPSAIFRYKVVHETRNVWKMYLDKEDFAKAKEYCKDNPLNLNKVSIKEAELLFAKKEYEKSALMYAGTQASFEEVTLKFINLPEKTPLRTFLHNKLDCMKKSDKTQITMLVTWLIEIYLNQLGELREQNGESTGAYIQLQDSFQHFLDSPKIQECVTKNRNTIYDLISSHGDVEDMVFFAKLMKDFERVIGHRIQHDDYSGALDILKRQNDMELFYKFSPLLMQYIPHDLVTAWITQEGRLNPKHLIPALVQYDHNLYKEQGNEAIRYLEFCITCLHTDDQAIHNFLLSLYVKLQPKQLMRYLHLQGQDPEALHYDIKFALRLCAEHGLKEACVHIYSVMGLYEEAVDLALSVDVDLAKFQADKPDDVELRKKLWLQIARHVVEEEKDVKKAMVFLQDCDLLKIEDVLPFFPDFVTIDHFKDAIIQSLQEYHKHIDDLKEQMEEATISADEIRKEIMSFRNKYTFVKMQDKCSSCNLPIMSRNFYLFPCQHKFHCDCLISEILPYMPRSIQLRIDEIRRQLADLIDNKRSSAMSPASPTLAGSSLDQALKTELDDLVAAECRFCGDIMIRSIDEPFIHKESLAMEMAGW